ncbi:MAG: hypothetical protein WDA60_16535 [Acidimicrobiia bacterium]
MRSTVFPPMVFFGVLLANASVEIAGFDVDDDYCWDDTGDIRPD